MKKRREFKEGLVNAGKSIAFCPYFNLQGDNKMEYDYEKTRYFIQIYSP